MTQTTKPEITATAIYKVTSKIDGKICWAVPSDSDPSKLYTTCYDEQSEMWTCTCRHGEVQAERNQPARCKHQRAAQVSIVANKQQAAQPAKVENLPTLNGSRERRFEQAPSGAMVPMR